MVQLKRYRTSIGRSSPLDGGRSSPLDGGCPPLVDRGRVLPPQRGHAVGMWLLCAMVLALVILAFLPHAARADGERRKYTSGNGYLIVELLDDDLAHFEYAPSDSGPDTSQPLFTSPMVFKTDYPGPSDFNGDGAGVLETAALRAKVDSETLCVELTDMAGGGVPLATICPQLTPGDRPGIAIQQLRSVSPQEGQRFTHAYGLGQQFLSSGSADGDWSGRMRTPGNAFGNAMTPFGGGNTGNTQIPVAYFLGDESACFALFLDSPYAQKWDLRRDPWKVELSGSPLRWYVLTGPDLLDLRQDYLELTGRPPVPPKKMFGLWVSEYGFDDWSELDDKLRTLRASHFPVDGFVLDLQWYGGIVPGSGESPMGRLTWDLERFPDPQGKISSLWHNDGIGIMLIEQPYVGQDLPEHSELERRGYLVRDCETCAATVLTANPWWGVGGMIDWTNEIASADWHDWKREPLIDAGIIGHWTDLGEPELYNPDAWYAGTPSRASGAGMADDSALRHGQADVHNLYNLKWSQSIYEGYVRNNRVQRPFILSRSGTAGSQRYGVAMWSGDIGSNLSSLATHLNAQMHMSFSGIDYYGADIGGFFRESLDGDLDEMYTQWFADGMALDVPARTHTMNLCNCYETAPDRIGDVQSNLANVRLRYELSPYLYSLAHRAYLYGEPVFPPLVFYYPDDINVREIGGEKLLGRDLLVAPVAAQGEQEHPVYLPAGEWVNYHTDEWLSSTGDWFGPFPLYAGGLFRLPLFVRTGAIIPQMYVDEQTMNISGKRADGSQRDELIVRVYASAQRSGFTLYEDDGATIAYQKGEVRTTLISQQQLESRAVVTISASSGTYQGALPKRDNVVRLVVNGMRAITVTLNGAALPQLAGPAELGVAPSAGLAAAGSGWLNERQNVIVAKSGRLDVGVDKVFELDLLSAEGLASAPQAGELAEPQPRAAVSLWRWGWTVAVLVAVILISLWLDLAYQKRHAR